MNALHEEKIQKAIIVAKQEVRKHASMLGGDVFADSTGEYIGISQAEAIEIAIRRTIVDMRQDLQFA